MSLTASDIHDLVTALNELSTASNSSTTISTDGSHDVNAVSLRLPEFWPEDPELWFTRVEAQFALRNISSDETKFNYVIATLDNNAASEVKSILINPPSHQKYSTIKSALLTAFGKSQLQKDAELLSISGLGDRKPTALLRKIQSLNSDIETLRRAFFLSQLPQYVRIALAAQNISDIEELAKAADRVVEMQNLCSASTLQAAGIRKTASMHQSSPSTDNDKPTDKSSNTVCYFHSKFGTKARKCLPGCIFADLLQISGNVRAGR